MKEFKILHTTDYLVCVSDEEIKVGDYRASRYGEVYKQETDKIFPKFNRDKKIMAHLPLNNSPILEGVPLLPKWNDVFYVWKLGRIVASKSKSSNKSAIINGFVKGYKAATKVYSEDDLWNAFLRGIGVSKINELNDTPIEIVFQEFIQSLKQPKYPNYFIPKLVDMFEENNENYVHSSGAKGSYSTHMKKFVITTNSEGQIVLIGTYKYK